MHRAVFVFADVVGARGCMREKHRRFHQAGVYVSGNKRGLCTEGPLHSLFRGADALLKGRAQAWDCTSGQH